MKTKRLKRQQKARLGGSLKPVCSAAMRGELMLLECGVDECSRGLRNLSLQLTNIADKMARIICEMQPNVGAEPPRKEKYE